MTKNNMNAIAADNTNITTAAGLFTEYINSDAAADEAAYKLREAICSIVLNNTAVKTRVDNNFYGQLIQEAEVFVCKKSIELYKDDKYVRTYTFIGNSQQFLSEIEKFFVDVIVGYNCFYEDKISYNNKEGFCWLYDGMKIAIV